MNNLHFLGRVFGLVCVVVFISIHYKVGAQEGCEVYGLILNEDKGSIEDVLIISYDGTEYEIKNKLHVIEEIRNAYLTNTDSVDRHSMGVSSPKGEFLFVMGTSKLAIIYHPDYYLKVIDRSRLESPCKFDLITLTKINTSEKANQSNFFIKKTEPNEFGYSVEDSTQCDMAGIYLSAKEFESNLLSDSVCIDWYNNSLKSLFLATVYGRNGRYMNFLGEGDSIKVYDYDSIFGLLYGGNKYRLEKKLFHSYHYNGGFMIADTNGLIIYTQKSNPELRTQFTRYFYSEGINGELKRLSYSNLKKDFPEKEEFLKHAREYQKSLNERTEQGNFILNELWNQYSYE